MVHSWFLKKQRAFPCVKFRALILTYLKHDNRESKKEDES